MAFNGVSCPVPTVAKTTMASPSQRRSLLTTYGRSATGTTTSFKRRWSSATLTRVSPQYRLLHPPAHRLLPHLHTAGPRLAHQPIPSRVHGPRRAPVL